MAAKPVQKMASMRFVEGYLKSGESSTGRNSALTGK